MTSERHFYWSVGCFAFMNGESPDSTLGCGLNVEFDAVGIQKGPPQQAVLDFLGSFTSYLFGEALCHPTSTE